MSADRSRKRLNDASIVGCSSWRQPMAKKRELNGKSHISLEWDGFQEKVVARTSQIGISQRSLRPFLGSVPQTNSALAEVFKIPQQIFELENLDEVLKYEVWQTHLSEDERNVLLNFLPGELDELDPEDTVKGLLAGENIHFGNPFLKWGALICSGKCHPDAVLQQEHYLKEAKKTHYMGIQKYHNDMINNLQKLKETWEGSKDFENEVMQKTCRFRRDAENGSRFCSIEENVMTASESSALPSEDKHYGSDNQNFHQAESEEYQLNAWEKGFVLGKSRNGVSYPDDATRGKGDKTSKKQHELVKSMKQSNKAIRSKSVNQVLESLDTFSAQPCEGLLKEEWEKLQKHWKQLSVKDVPVAFANWRERLLQKQKICLSLEKELKNRLQAIAEFQSEDKVDKDGRINNEVIWFEKEENSIIELEDQTDHGPGKQEFVVEGDGLSEATKQGSITDSEEDSESGKRESFVETDGNSVPGEYESIMEGNGDTEPGKPEPLVRADDEDSEPVNKQESCMEADGDSEDEDSGSESPSYSPPQENYCVGTSGEFNQVVVDSKIDHVAVDTEYCVGESEQNNCVVSQMDNYFSDVPPYSVLGTADIPINQQTASPGGNVWSTVAMPCSYYDTTSNHEYVGANDLSMPHQLQEDQRTQLIEMELSRNGEESQKDFLQRQPAVCSPPYPNHEQSGLLQSLFKDQGFLSLNNKPKQAGLDIQSSSSLLIEDGRFRGHLHGQLQSSRPLPHEQGRNHQDVLPQNISEAIYPDGVRYLIPGRGHLSPVGIPDWVINPIHMSPHVPSNVSDNTLFPQNLYSGDYQGRGSWNGSDVTVVSSQGIRINADQRPYSVFQQSNQLHSVGGYNSVGSSEQLMMSRNYGMIGSGGGGPFRMNTVLANPLDYLSTGGRNTTGSLIPEDMVWMNFTQNSSLHNPVRKP